MQAQRQPNAAMPGRAAFCGTALAAAVGGGAHRTHQRGPKLVLAARSAAAPQAAAGAATGVAPGTLSPDRTHWFNRSAWRPTQESAPPGAPRSDDGFSRWDGAAWRPVPR